MVTAARSCSAPSGMLHSFSKKGCNTYEAKVRPIIAFVVGLSKFIKHMKVN